MDSNPELYWIFPGGAVHESTNVQMGSQGFPKPEEIQYMISLVGWAQKTSSRRCPGDILRSTSAGFLRHKKVLLDSTNSLLVSELLTSSLRTSHPAEEVHINFLYL